MEIKDDANEVINTTGTEGLPIPKQGLGILMSDKIDKIAPAYVAAWAESEGAEKSAENPFFKSSYADQSSTWAAFKGPWAKHKLAILQATAFKRNQWVCVTMILHESGQYIAFDLPILATQQTPQAFGSGFSYARRYAALGGAGIPTEDDDGEKAMGRGQQPPKSQPEKQEPLPTTEHGDYPRNPGWETQAITEAQRKKLWAMAKAAGWDEAALKDVIKKVFGKNSTKALTKLEAQKLFDDLEKAVPR